jgi:equilibrative nucleoside transporter 1/2/3
MKAAAEKPVHADNILPFKDRSEREPLLGARAGSPADTCRLAYCIFFLHGVGHLLPWNFFITAQLYFQTKFTCPHGNSTGYCVGFNSSFENWFSVASMVPIFGMSAANVWLQSKFHYRLRMVVSLVVMLLLFLLTTALVGVSTTAWTDGFFAVTLLSVFLMNSASSVFQSSTFGFAGVLPHSYTSAVMSGQAVAGVFAALASILSQVISSSAHGGQSPGAITDSAFGYFGVACLVILLCLGSVFFLSRLPFVEHYLEKTSVQVQKQKQQKAEEASLHTKVIVHPSYLGILRKVLWYAVSVYLVFTVTISLFPAIISQVVSSAPDPGSSGWTSTYFSSLVCFLMFNVSDLTGRFITHWTQVGRSHRTLLLLTALRCLFIPAVLFCNVQVKGGRELPTYSHHPEYDIIPITLITLFGLSNGYLGSVAMVTAPQLVRADEKETASTIMAFFLSGGLFSGGVLSFLWTFVVSP